MSSLSFTKSTLTRGKDEVYVAAVPLRAAKGVAQLFMSTAYSLNFWDLQHFMVIVKPSSSPLPSQAFVFDFQPEDPENIYTALAALSGRAVPGVVLARKLTKLPRRKCWFVGYSNEDAVGKAYKFNNTWGADLRVGLHDCRDYTNGLVEHLTGEKLVLEHLRRTTDGQS
ncbi:PTB domain-containing engulfment adapter protein 1 isoform 1 [Theobroma cacao]|uniref:PTB domain-containing engulfment adapter protein 1 isoform 1 n=1 Tax=Theobroma cacao TaxID=3641 RepID=A0A061DLR9_THECC|nr:PTB domain-containing engulfment adapter protein 1 isoform 1 [Theobroma cacao]